MQGKHKLSRGNSSFLQTKDSTHLNQLQTIFRYLQHHTATASMVAEATKIPQKNITRYKRDLEKAGKLWETVKDVCKHTGNKAWYITTDASRRFEAREGHSL
jgi:DNA-binding MarR family transcriptional regulator